MSTTIEMKYKDILVLISDLGLLDGFELHNCVWMKVSGINAQQCAFVIECLPGGNSKGYSPGQVIHFPTEQMVEPIDLKIVITRPSPE